MPHLHSQALLSPDQLQALGLLTAEWALLEVNVNITIWRILNADREHGHSVTCDLSSLHRINMLSALGKLKFEKSVPAAWDELKALVARMKNLNTWRNRIVHNMWLPNHAADVLRAKHFTIREGKLQERQLELERMALFAKAQEVSALSDELLAFQRRYDVGPPPSQTK